MNRNLIIAILATFFIAAAGDGCSEQNMPTARQIELNIPKSMRTCPGIPKSPGAKATNAATAEYITRLYGALKICKGNLGRIDDIYEKWQARVTAAS